MTTENPQISALKQRAKDGDAMAQANLGQALAGQDFEEAYAWMAKAAAQGLAEAHYFLGVWNLEGIMKPRELKAGISHLEEAEAKGLAQARHFQAYMKARGLGVKPDWAGGLSDVMALAKAGNPFGLSQIGFLLRLSGDGKALSLGETFIQAAAAGGNPQALGYFGNSKPKAIGLGEDQFAAAQSALKEVPNPSVPEPKNLSLKPRVAIFPRFIPPEIADYLISRARPGLKPSLVIDNIHGRFVHDTIRTSTEHRFLPHKADLVTHAVCERIAKASGEPVANQEILGVLRYQPGQEYKAHSDYLKPDAEGKNPEAERSGQRIKTFLIYLNEGFEGGGTQFPRLGLEVKPNKGDGVFFVNVNDIGEESRLSVHAGLPVKAGEKFITTLWIRDRTYSFPAETRAKPDR